MAWRAGRALKWGPNGKDYAIGDVVPVDVNDRHLWWLMRDGTTVVPETAEDLPPGASPFSFDPIIQAANRRIDRAVAIRASNKADDRNEVKRDERAEEVSDAVKAEKAETATKKAPAKKATKTTTKKAAHS